MVFIFNSKFRSTENQKLLFQNATAYISICTGFGPHSALFFESVLDFIHAVSISFASFMISI